MGDLGSYGDEWKDGLLALEKAYMKLLDERDKLRSEVERLQALEKKTVSVPDQYADIFEFNIALRQLLCDAEDEFGAMMDERDKLRATVAEVARLESEE